MQHPGLAVAVALGVGLILAPARASAVCGNGVVEAGEQCDDGNVGSGDGCSASCQFEGCDLTGTWESTYFLTTTVFTIVEGPGGALSGISYPAESPGAVSPISGTRNGVNVTLTVGGVVRTATTTQCDEVQLTGGFHPPHLMRQRDGYCGDGVLQAADEACDDGNLANGDACSVACIAPACGNGVAETPDECDDGNPTDGDGCSTTCQVNDCGNGAVEPGEECDDGNDVDGDGCSATLCQVNVCGNGALEPGEQCDDGNVAGGDECSPLCQFLGCDLTGTWERNWLGQVETTYTIVESAGGALSGLSHPVGNPGAATPISGVRSGVDVTLTSEGNTRTGTMTSCDRLPLTGGQPPARTLDRRRDTYCGDGAIQAPVEACDDGNLANGDACSVACGSPTCGNRAVEAPEQCDDGNPTNGDGCSTTCQTNVCGNGTIESGEGCDDGNTIDGDGCSGVLCQTNVCGNGAIEPGEQCDDGNTVGGDECSPLCQFLGCGLTGTWTSTFLGEVRVWTLVEGAGGALVGVTYPLGSPVAVEPLSGTRTGVQVSLQYRNVVMTATMDECDNISFSAVGIVPPNLFRQRDTYCGDGVIQGPDETCDDGNLSNGDVCAVSCVAGVVATTTTTSSTSTTTTSSTSTTATTSTSTTSSTSTTIDPSLRSFGCYAARPAQAVGYGTMSLVDRFGALAADVVRPVELCTPADEGGAPADPAQLAGFQVRASGFARVANEHVTTSLGEVVVDLVKPTGVLVPSGGTGLLDHFTCYKVKPSRGAAKFAKRTGVIVSTRYELLAVDVIKPRRLCVPADANGASPGAAAHPEQLLCYGVRASRFGGATETVTNGLGTQTLALTKRTELCLPSVASP